MAKCAMGLVTGANQHSFAPLCDILHHMRWRRSPAQRMSFHARYHVLGNAFGKGPFEAALAKHSWYQQLP